MNTESLNDMRRIVQSIFISGNLTPTLSLELCDEYCDQILEVINEDSLSTGT
jgi:hypothetical protein